VRMIAPKLDAPQISVGENQHEFLTITAAMVAHPDFDAPGGMNTLVYCYRLEEHKRARIAAGEDLYVSLLTFGKPVQPIIVCVGPEGPAAWYGVRVTP